MIKQPSLFEQTSGEKINIENGILWWFPNWLSRSKANDYFNQLRNEIAWQQSQLHIAGKAIDVPRLNAWYGEENTQYEYSGIAFNPIPFTKTLRALKHQVLQTSQLIDLTPSFSINSALANLYRDGKDSVAWHADDEKELGASPQIASLSFGESRRFLLKSKAKGSKTVELVLSPGSLLFMLGDIQHHWLHSIPKTNDHIGERINITFRHVYPSF